MAYSADSFVADEQPTTAKWNKLWSNDASFNDGSGFANGALGSVHASLANGIAVQSVYTTYTAVNTGTTVIPSDDTIPQNTEGTEFMSQTITPKSTTNILEIDINMMLSSLAAARWCIAALFQDSTANALAVGEVYIDTATALETLHFKHIMVAGTTSATTFKVRGGPNSATTVTFNGSNSGRLFGATVKSSIQITEYKAA